LSNIEEVFMVDGPRITGEELKKRIDAGEDFTVIDVRNPQAWAESDTMLPEAIRVPLDTLEDENLLRIPKNKPCDKVRLIGTEIGRSRGLNERRAEPSLQSKATRGTGERTCDTVGRFYFSWSTV
jgi:hypothetical protein